MAAVRVQAAVSFRLDEIYRYTRDRWGTERADDPRRRDAERQRQSIGAQAQRHHEFFAKDLAGVF